MNENIKRGLVAAGVLAASVVASSAHAAAGAAVDVTDVVGTIGNQLASVGLVGAAVLGIVVAVKAFKWVRGALS